ncbi:DUF4957 domain-containing protein [Chitinophaga horti]|uniref:DUF4957 domain-containing protein n=1 Tax=Chitinophaga horti TaxID=2920382 RepID=A0ABY6J9B1_9BACT|nr:DUF4957 domain-containing protein [Chitinophaga horti]UYQ94871.1 DUF4957 domain-containing protein [Chitinophaga horti]
MKILSTYPLLLLLLLVAACSPEKEKLAPMRMFMPKGIIQANSEATSVLLSWEAALYSKEKGTTYTVAISDDTLFSHTTLLLQTDTTGIRLDDTQLGVRKFYYARVKTNGPDSTLDSKWVHSNRFQITGEQIFQPTRTAEIKAISVTLRWTATAGVSKITLLPNGGTLTDVPVTAAESADGAKVLKGLTPNTDYYAEIFAGTKSKGYTVFKTLVLPNFTVVVKPTDNLITVLDTCSNNAFIGLEPGTHDIKDAGGAYANLVVRQKTVTIQSLSGDPSDTKVNFKEITLKGDGAGIKLNGIEFDGTAGAGAYFLNLVGLNADGEAATFTSIEMENCRIHHTVNCIFRGNRASANLGHKISLIKMNNCIAYENGGSYTYFTLDKLDIARLELTNSTFYNIGRAFISWSTNVTPAAKPVMTIDACTFNNFGSDGRNYVLLDANANALDFVFQNSILCNLPKAGGTMGNALLRATGAASTLSVSYNNMFNLTTGAGAAATLPTYAYLTATNNKAVDLGWTATTTNFTLPAGSELRTAGKTGGAVGDPRWTY